jgi:hypothetical protein
MYFLFQVVVVGTMVVAQAAQLMNADEDLASL